MNKTFMRSRPFEFLLLLVFAFGLSLTAWTQGTQKVVRVQGKAIPETVRPGERFQIQIDLNIATGYHINAHVPTLEYLIATTASFEAPPGITIGEVKYPAPLQKKFGFAPDTPLAVLEGDVVLTAAAEVNGRFRPLPDEKLLVIRAKVIAQACNDSQCLAPASLKVEVPLNFSGGGVKASGGKTAEPQKSLPTRAPHEKVVPQLIEKAAPSREPLFQFDAKAAEPRNSVADLIANQGFALTLFFVFLSGLALNTTPCVYPIIPITIGFFANQSEGRLSRTFLMALLYVLGMATTYSVLGVVASLTKGFFGAALQNPLVLILLAMIMTGLALSMFGVYEFRLPFFLNRLASESVQSSHGMLSALVMGLTMGIVAAPCIGPFVLGLLVHVGAKGDPVYGFFMFFVLSLGLGFPYLILGTFSGALSHLPRSGQWMVSIRKIFGFVLVGLALYFLMPLVGSISKYAFALLLAVAAVYFLFVEARKAKPAQFGWLLRLLGVVFFASSVFFLLPERKVQAISWEFYTESAVARAAQSGMPVIIDAYADWCIPCKELDKFTFADSAVRQEASSFMTLKLDLTQNVPGTEASRAKEKFGIQGVPTILFLDAVGQERRALRLEGFEKPELFFERMKAAKKVQ